MIVLSWGHCRLVLSPACCRGSTRGAVLSFAVGEQMLGHIRALSGCRFNKINTTSARDYMVY